MSQKFSQSFVRKCLRFDIARAKRKGIKKSRVEVSKLVVIYRISDAGYLKEKPSYINNENCLRNAVHQFPLSECEWYIIADNVCEDTYNMILKYVPENQVQRVSVGHGAGTFRLGYEHALKYDDDVCVYFLENDYLHNDHSMQVLKEAFVLAESDYITLYDHPDKYGYDAENPFIFGGEQTKLFLTPSAHWKITNSTTMTFAARVKVLREDKKVFWRWTATSHPYDFEIFYELKRFRKRILISSVPGYSTHGEVKYFSPLIDWESIGRKSLDL